MHDHGAGIAFLITFISGVAITSAASTWATRQGYRHLWPPLVPWIVAPSVIVHEMAHLLVLAILGYRIRGVDLGGAFDPRRPARVRFSWNQGNARQRLGLVFAAFAPALLPLLVIALWHAFPVVPQGALEWAAAGYVLVVLAGASGLSEEDWSAATQGMFIFAAVVVVVAWLNPNDIFTAPNHAPWQSAATIPLITAFMFCAAIQLTLGVIYTGIGVTRGMLN